MNSPRIELVAWLVAIGVGAVVVANLTRTAVARVTYLARQT